MSNARAVLFTLALGGMVALAGCKNDQDKPKADATTTEPPAGAMGTGATTRPSEMQEHNIGAATRPAETSGATSAPTATEPAEHTGAAAPANSGTTAGTSETTGTTNEKSSGTSGNTEVNK